MYIVDIAVDRAYNGSTPSPVGPRSPGANSPGVRWATLVFYSLTFLFGLFGNTLVIYVIAKYDRIRARSVSNYYIWNLSLADELFVLTIPFFGYTSFTHNWVFGEWACKVRTV